MYLPLIVLTAVLSIGCYQSPLISELLAVGSGFTATAVCYGHYVSRRDVRTVVANELAGLPSFLTAFAIEEETQSVVAFTRVFFTKELADHFGATTRAYYLGQDLGCQLSRTPETVARTREITAHDKISETILPIAVNDQVQTLLNYEVTAEAIETNQTRAIIVLHHGRIVGEAYQFHLGITKDTPLLGWSMTKSVQSLMVCCLNPLSFAYLNETQSCAYRLVL